MRKNSIKNTRVNGEVMKELSNIIRNEIKDPRIHTMTKQLGTAEGYLMFLYLPEREAKREYPEAKNVQFSHVSFSYPNATKESLTDINLTIKERETIAIVGSNGAGKSTFARLLLGIYEPTKGSVYLDGVDTRELNPNDSSGCVSAVFQKFLRYKMTLRENVILSDSNKPIDEHRVETALRQADIGVKSACFSDGLDTMLAREFGGTDISGGQWQRLAIARGFYRRHNLIVLDEPTAAIDPLEETAIYQKFARISEDKTAVIITHRLGSARIADRIIVLDNGRIAETGTHEELIAAQGLYCKMYMAQAKWYQ